MNAMRFVEGSIHVFHWEYLDFARLFLTETAEAYFVIRSKSDTYFYVLVSRPINSALFYYLDVCIRLLSNYSDTGKKI